MKDTQQVRTAVIGLIAFAGVEEQAVLRESSASGHETSTPANWGARTLVAHNTEFKLQQLERLVSVREGRVPPEFEEIDHRSEEVHRRYEEQSEEQVANSSRSCTSALIDEVQICADEDLLDPSRHSWLAGRQLWLQTVVRGFWYLAGILGYYVAHGEPGRAVWLHERAVSLGSFLSAPGTARAMAFYNLACAQARAESPDSAIASLGEAINLNPQLATNAARDPDFGRLRDAGRLKALLASD